MGEMERFNLKNFLSFLLISFIFICLILFSGFYGVVHNVYYQSIFEEIFRFVFIFISFRSTRLIIYPSIAYAISELLFSTFVNYILFSPDYLEIFSDESYVAYLSIICSFLIGVCSGFIYYENEKLGYAMYWGIFLSFTLKYFLRWVPSNSFYPFNDEAMYIAFYAIYIFILSFIIYFMYKRNSRR